MQDRPTDARVVHDRETMHSLGIWPSGFCISWTDARQRRRVQRLTEKEEESEEEEGLRGCMEESLCLWVDVKSRLAGVHCMARACLSYAYLVAWTVGEIGSLQHGRCPWIDGNAVRRVFVLYASRQLARVFFPRVTCLHAHRCLVPWGTSCHGRRALGLLVIILVEMACRHPREAGQAVCVVSGWSATVRIWWQTISVCRFLRWTDRPPAVTSISGLGTYTRQITIYTSYPVVTCLVRQSVRGVRGLRSDRSVRYLRCVELETRLNSIRWSVCLKSAIDSVCWRELQHAGALAARGCFATGQNYRWWPSCFLFLGRLPSP